MHGEGAWMVGDCEPIGGQADITTAGVNFSAPNPLISTLFFSAGEGPAFPIFGFGGKFALDLLTLSPVTVSFGTTKKDGIASLSFQLPNDPTLQNVSIALQAVVSNLTLATFTLTNTAWLHIK